jgi:hypothetical protein
MSVDAGALIMFVGLVRLGFETTRGKACVVLQFGCCVDKVITSILTVVKFTLTDPTP